MPSIFRICNSENIGSVWARKVVFFIFLLNIDYSIIANQKVINH